MANRRILRINDQLREEVAQMLRELKDPELEKLISITEVDTSPDLAHAKVYVSTLGDEADIDRTIARLQRAARYIRREIARRLSLRKMPELEFKADVSLIRGARVTRLLYEQERQRQS